MKHIIQVFFISSFLFQTSCQEHEQISSNPTYFSKHDLRGTWSFVRGSWEVIPEIDYAIEGSVEDYTWDSTYLIIKDDSVSFFDFPREYYGTYHFQIDSNKLLVDMGYPRFRPLKEGETNFAGRSNKWKSGSINFSGDTLLYSTFYLNYYIIIAHFVRDTADAETIKILLRDSVSAYELIGQWSLVTKINDHSYGYSGYEIIFPFDMPHFLNYTTSDILSPKVQGRKLTISVNERPREFSFGYFNADEIWLKPSEWYQGEQEPEIYYNKLDE